VPIIKSAIKRMRQTTVRRARNVATKKNMRSAVKSFIAQPSIDGLRAAQSEIDTALKKNILKKNTASRKKAHLAKVAKVAGVSVATEKIVAKTTAKTSAATKAAPKKPAAAKTTATKSATAKKTTAKPAAKKTASDKK
jgi:ribosomal protein S20